MDFGITDGSKIRISRSNTDGQEPEGSRFKDFATELARLPLDAVFAVNTPAALAMKRTGTALPVVFAQVSEPVAIGLVESLPRPGKNFTGLTTINRELMPKRR